MTSKERKKLQSEYQYCIKDLQYALEHVDNDYVSWSINNSIQEGNEGRNDIQRNNNIVAYCERVYAYELYHQFRRLMWDNKMYQDLFFNGEQQKDNSHMKELFKSIQEKKIIPDLILHKHLGATDEGQIMYIEIKTIKNSKYLDDLKKLSKLAHSNLGFIFYIFIYVDATIDDLKNRLKRIRKKIIYKELDGSILCFCVKDNHAPYKSIKNIKKDIEKNKM